MQFRFERAIAEAIHGRQRFVEDRDGAVGIASPRFGFGQRNLQKPVEPQNVLFAQLIDAAAHVLKPIGGPAAVRSRPTLQKHAKGAPQVQIVLVREADQF